LSVLSVFSLVSFSKNEIKKTNEDIIDTNAKLIPNNPWDFLTEYSAIYQVYYDDDLVGTANETLTFDNDLWKLEMSARLKKFFFKIRSNEFSEFAFNNQVLYTQRFYSKTEITFKKDKVIEQIFDWKNKVETGLYKKRSWQIPLEQQVFDRMSHTIQLRQNLFNSKNSSPTKESSPTNESSLTKESNSTNESETIPLEFLVSHKGKRESYIYKSLGIEKLNTPFGDYDAVKLERTKKNGDKFLIWLSPKLNYFPIKISQKEEDKSEVSFLLKSLTYSKTNEAVEIPTKI